MALGIKIELSNKKQISDEFDQLLKDLQEKANSKPIKIEISDLTDKFKIIQASLNELNMNGLNNSVSKTFDNLNNATKESQKVVQNFMNNLPIGSGQKTKDIADMLLDPKTFQNNAEQIKTITSRLVKEVTTSIENQYKQLYKQVNITKDQFPLLNEIKGSGVNLSSKNGVFDEWKSTFKENGLNNFVNNKSGHRVDDLANQFGLDNNELMEKLQAEILQYKSMGTQMQEVYKQFGNEISVGIKEATGNIDSGLNKLIQDLTISEKAIEEQESKLKETFQATGDILSKTSNYNKNGKYTGGQYREKDDDDIQTTTRVDKNEQIVSSQVTENYEKQLQLQKQAIEYGQRILDNVKNQDLITKEQKADLEGMLKVLQEENGISSNAKNIAIQYFQDIQKEINAKQQSLKVDKETLEIQEKLNQQQQKHNNFLNSLGKDITPNGFNFDVKKSSYEDVERLVKAHRGLNAEIKKVDIQPLEKEGEVVRTVTYRVKDGKDKWHEYKMAMIEATDGGQRSLRELDLGSRDVINRQVGFLSRLKNAWIAVASFGGVTTVFYTFMNQIKEGFALINDLNKASTNIQMITGMSSDSIKGLTSDLGNLAGELHTTTAEIMSGSEEFLRAGHNMSETRNLLKASTIGSAISGQDNKTVSEQLIAISNGYKLNTNNAKELMGVIDKLSAVDNSSATSLKC